MIKTILPFVLCCNLHIIAFAATPKDSLPDALPLTSAASISLARNSSQAQSYSYATDNKLLYFIRDKKELQILVFDTSFSLIKQIDYDLEDFIGRQEGVIGIAETDGKLTLYFSDDKLGAFSSLTMDMESYTLFQYEYGKIGKKEEYVNAFAANGKFYSICYHYDYDPQLIFRELTPGKPALEHTVNIHHLPFNIGRYNNILWELFLINDQIHRGSLVSRINPNEPNDHISAKARAKLYVADSSVIFTFNHVTDTTQVLTINLNTFQPDFRKISAKNIVYQKGRNTTENSFLLNDRLFHISIRKKGMALKVLDFETGSVLKEFLTTFEQPIPYKNGPYMRFSGSKISYENFSSKKIFRELYEAPLGIGVNNYAQKNALEITIGTSYLTDPLSYYNPWIHQNMMPAPMPRMNIGFRMLLPSIIWNYNFSNRLSQFYGSSFFRVYIDKTTFDPVIKTPEPTFSERYVATIKNIENEHSDFRFLTNTRSVRALNSINFKNKLVISFYDKENRQYKLFYYTPY